MLCVGLYDVTKRRRIKRICHIQRKISLGWEGLWKFKMKKDSYFYFQFFIVETNKTCFPECTSPLNSYHPRTSNRDERLIVMLVLFCKKEETSSFTNCHRPAFEQQEESPERSPWGVEVLAISALYICDTTICVLTLELQNGVEAHRFSRADWINSQI